MHFLSYVVIAVPEDVEKQVAIVMAPFREDQDGEEVEGIWDWYQIGGRWTGYLDGYDPDKDPKNQETCPICHGTGVRNDGVGQQMREENPEYQCNGCGGKSTRVKWPTKWETRAGDVMPLDDLPEDKRDPHTLFVGPSEVIDKGWAFNEDDFPGWADEHTEKCNEIEARIDQQHTESLKTAFDGLQGKGKYVVVVDYHS